MNMNMNTERIKVLYVDDEEGNLKAFKATFRREMDIHIALSGQEGLDLLEKEEVHVVISDQRMPGMTGAEFLAIVKERHPKPMRMLLTGYADLEAVIQAVNQGGIYAYATKPWDPNDLKLRIQQAYEVHALRTHREQLLGRYGQVFQLAADPIVIVDQSGCVHDANPATLKLLGVSGETLKERGFKSFLSDPRALMRSLKARRQGRDFVNVDLTLHAHGDKVIDCLMTATHMGSTEDGHALFQAMIKDITDRRQEEARLRRLNSDLDRRVSVRTKQLLDALEDLGSFSYSVAHDLRSPLKNVQALGQLLHEHLADAADHEALALTDRIQKGTTRMLQLVDDLLRFSQTNTRELQKQDVDLRAIVMELITEQVPQDRLSQVTCLMDEDLMVRGDAPMIKVALQNLLSNALKFTGHEELPEIGIGASVNNGEVVVWVKDNGVGFDADRADQVFGVFKRMHDQNQFEGTGVGLAIVQRIMQKHGGRAWAESAPGCGTTVHLEFPVEDIQRSFMPFGRVA